MADASTTEKAAVQKKRLDAPDETRAFGKGKAEVVKLGDVSIFRLHYEPGWRWSEHIKPMAKTDRCEVRHVGYMVQGRLKIVGDRKSTRLNSSHLVISYAVFCLKK